jgi:hypothetical protein
VLANKDEAHDAPTVPAVRARASAGLAVPWGRIPLAWAANGPKLAKYIQPLPLRGRGIVVATPSGLDRYSFTQRELALQLHPQLPPTPLWAYDDGSSLEGQFGSFGLAIVARSGTPLEVSYTHNLLETYPPGSRSTRG